MQNLVNEIILNRYHVQEMLGRGGMAEVYKVWDRERMAYLAMKVLAEDMATDKVFLRRFKREANTLSKLQHPSIVRFYGIEEDRDFLLTFMMMDFIGGETLKRRIYREDAPLALEVQRDVLKAVCGALQYAHSMGFVHADIKPANIMFDEYGRVMLTDFGIARMSDAATATMVGGWHTGVYVTRAGEGFRPQSAVRYLLLGHRAV